MESILRLNDKDIHKADAWFDKYGVWTVFFGSLVPLVRSLISIPAGMSNMNFGLFLLLTTIGTLIWNTALVSVGAAVGDNWDRNCRLYGYLFECSVCIIAIVGIAVLVWYFKKRS